MKTIITITDDEKGGVDVQYMTQMTATEKEQGLQPMQSAGYRTALLINDIFNNAKSMIAEERQTDTSRSKSCLH
ncbi:MAG: hypothetical protein WCS28_12350 [Thiomicrospira sp.]|jgi:hypothetical protein